MKPTYSSEWDNSNIESINKLYSHPPSMPYNKISSFTNMDDKCKNKILNEYFKGDKKKYNKMLEIEQKTTFKHVYAIGDIHGDYNAFKTIMEGLCYEELIETSEQNNTPDDEYNPIFTKEKIQIFLPKIREKGLKWNPKVRDVCIIQTGDIMDGYRQKNHQLDSNTEKTAYKATDLQIIKELLELKKEAYQYNSNIILLYGNHELMNIFNEFDLYLLKIENNNFVDVPCSKNMRYPCANIFKYKLEDINKFDEKDQEEKEYIIKEIFNEVKQLKKDILCNYKTYAIINGYLFCHCGFIKKYIDELLKLDLNDSELKGIKSLYDIKEKYKKLPYPEIAQQVINITNKTISKILYFLWNVFEDLNPKDYNNAKLYDIQQYCKYILNILWAKDYDRVVIYNKDINNTQDEQNQLFFDNIKKSINEIITYLGVKGMIIGHFQNNDITTYLTVNYNNETLPLIYDIDVGLSEGFHHVQNDETVYMNKDYYILYIKEDEKPKKLKIHNKRFDEIPLETDHRVNVAEIPDI